VRRGGVWKGKLHTYINIDRVLPDHYVVGVHVAVRIAAAVYLQTMTDLFLSISIVYMYVYIVYERALVSL